MLRKLLCFLSFHAIEYRGTKQNAWYRFHVYGCKHCDKEFDL